MTQEEYDKLTSENPNVGLVRPHWNEEEYHKKLWEERSVTVLICQRKTKDTTTLTLESLFRFYPDIPVLVVDGNSEDDSILYLKVKSALYPNLKIWERIGRNSHGETMDEAIRNYITTRYVILMDSDVIIVRGGWIEEMLNQFKENTKLYATGTLMLVSRENQACDVPKNQDDIMRYAHPSCSIYHVSTYKTLKPFLDHGAACCNNIENAQKIGLEIGYYPVDKYVAHLSGRSWCQPSTTWSHDNNTFVIPIITFIITKKNHFVELEKQTHKDFDIVVKGNYYSGEIVVHGSNPVNISNWFYSTRLYINGEYICLLNESINTIDDSFVFSVMNYIIENNAPDTFIIGGIELIKRKIWQRVNALQ